MFARRISLRGPNLVPAVLAVEIAQLRHLPLENIQEEPWIWIAEDPRKGRKRPRRKRSSYCEQEVSSLHTMPRSPFKIHKLQHVSAFGNENRVPSAHRLWDRHHVG